MAPAWYTDIREAISAPADGSPRSDAGILCIATYHPNEAVTINLKGPIVYHKKTGHARQVVPLNAASLSLSHPMGN